MGYFFLEEKDGNVGEFLGGFVWDGWDGRSG
jgi:hypothetical protein